jgi:hypothetical protein
MGFLVLIGCQECSQTFLVGHAWEPWEWMYRNPIGAPRANHLEEKVKDYHYGDPPRHGGCVGETMNNADLQIIRAYQKSPTGTFVHRWERVTRMEVSIAEGWEIDRLKDLQWSTERVYEYNERFGIE